MAADPDELALLAAVVASADEDTPRLVYADWLDERGSAADRARAEFIRCQISSERFGDEAAARRSADLLRDHEARWGAGPCFACAGSDCGGAPAGCRDCGGTGARPWPIPRTAAVAHRVFGQEVRAPGEDEPAGVTILWRRGFSYRICPPDMGWCAKPRAPVQCPACRGHYVNHGDYIGDGYSDDCYDCAQGFVSPCAPTGWLRDALRACPTVREVMPVAFEPEVQVGPDVSGRTHTPPDGEGVWIWHRRRFSANNSGDRDVLSLFDVLVAMFPAHYRSSLWNDRTVRFWTRAEALSAFGRAVVAWVAAGGEKRV